MKKQEIQPTMFIFAGNNGSGKSTVRNLIAEKVGIEFNIDPDSLTRKYYDLNNPELRAGKEAIFLINECINNRRSFSMETTLSGKLVINQIKEAKKNGFEIIMFYAGLEDVKLNIKRVAYRVKSGGHHIPTEDILRRKDRTTKNLINNIDLIDHIQLIDNTQIDAEIILVFRNKLFLYRSNVLPEWAIPISATLEKLINK